MRCAQCGYAKFYVDKARMRRNNGKLACLCDAYHYPHRYQSGQCIHGPNPYGSVSFEPPPPPFDYSAPDDDDGTPF